MSLNKLNEYKYDPTIKNFDLSDGFIEIYDQGELGSCAINAFCALFNYELVRALGMAQPKTSIALNNYLSIFMLSCIRNGTSTKYKCTVVDKKAKPIYKDIKHIIPFRPFRPSRYYLYYYACNRNNNNINPNNFKNGGGSDIGLIVNAIKLHGILEELPNENDNVWQLEKSLDNPMKKTELSSDDPKTKPEIFVKITELENKITELKKKISELDNKNPKNTDDIKKIKNEIIKTEELINNYLNLKFNYTNIYYEETSEEIIEANKWKNIKLKKLIDINTKENNLINIITIKENSTKISICDIRKYLQNSKPILIGMKFNLNNQILNQFYTIIPSSINNDEKGRHMMVIVGYDDNKHAFKIRNSWGAGWGKGGYCYLSYGFFDLTSNVNYNIELYVLNLDLEKFPQTV